MTLEVSYTVAEISRMLKISKGNVRIAFRDAHGVIRNNVGRYGVMRIPEHVVVEFAARHGYPRPRKGMYEEPTTQNNQRDSAGV